MSGIHADTLTEELRPVRIKRHPIRNFLTRLRRASRLARRRLTDHDAQALYLECQKQLGWYALDLLTVRDAIEAAREVFNENPELPRLIMKACATVGARWDATENTAKARERVFDLAEAYSQTQDKFITFPLTRRSAAKSRPAPDPRRLLQTPNCSQEFPEETASLAEFGHDAARRDGWFLIDQGTYPNGSPHIEIQASKPHSSKSPRFSCDHQAWDHVVQQARTGSTLHLTALARIDPRERMAIEASSGRW